MVFATVAARHEMLTEIAMHIILYSEDPNVEPIEVGQPKMIHIDDVDGLWEFIEKWK